MSSHKSDLILLHPPSIYDFRKKSIMFGPISDLVPSTPVFEMYPIGFVSISEYLGKHGFEVRIINVAVKMLRSQRYSAEKEIQALKPMIFGIDLHWMPHAHGSIALAEIVKKYHPDTPVIFGGLSSSYFHKDLIDNYPCIDFVMRGDSTEEPLRQLLSALKAGQQDFSAIPNLTWRDKDKKTVVNPLTNVPQDLDYVRIDFSHVMKKVIKYHDLAGYTPYANWLKYPAVAVVNVKGCTQQCKICGGSAYFFKNTVKRKKAIYRDPELFAKEIKEIDRNFRSPIFIIGDILQSGRDYALSFLAALKKEKIKSPVGYEFFCPPEDDILEAMAAATPNFNLEMSPESHDERLRRFFGRPYNNESLERMINTGLQLGCQRLDLFYIIGIQGQTYQSVMETVEYCRYLYSKFGKIKPKSLLTFISPYAPFIDPGSEAYENPEKFGYKIYCKTVEDHRRALEKPSWKHILSYETNWMTRDEIVDASYEAAIRMNRLKMEYDIISRTMGLSTQERMISAREMIKKIDEVYAISNNEEREAAFEKLRLSIKRLNENTICDKSELEWPAQLLRMRFRWFLHNWYHIEIVHRFTDLFNRLKGNPIPLSHLSRKS
ncbi:MAG: TIGR04190 family B12-binding domain/radical SAM domain protein [bacterium]